MEIYGRVRRAVRVEGRSQRAVAREFGLSRETASGKQDIPREYGGALTCQLELALPLFTA